ncbi:MAG: CSLREA domain-containing protein, partial [Acidimicrobiales bacterium]
MSQARGRGGEHRQVVRRRWLRVVVGLLLFAPATMFFYPPDEVIAAPTTLVVNSTVDAADTNPGDGVCATGAGTCTLRAAIQEANAVDDPNNIEVPAGTYVLALFGAGEDAAASGDLDITTPLS